MTNEALLSSANRDPERSPARRPRGLPCYDPPRPVTEYGPIRMLLIDGNKLAC
ncbi:hypothetical protein ACROYT_G015067 [Oculina patagonica]